MISIKFIPINAKFKTRFIFKNNPKLIDGNIRNYVLD